MSLFLTISCFISLQPLLPHVSFCLVSVLGWNIAVQHCVMESQTSIIPYPVHRLQKKQLQGIGLPVKPEGCEGRATCSPAPQEAWTLHTLFGQDISKAKLRYHKKRTPAVLQCCCCSAVKPCYSDTVFYREASSFMRSSDHVFLKNSPGLFLSKTMWPLEVP